MSQKVGKYELVRKLATGGMAEVFLARFEWARGLEKMVVVKRILYHLAEDPNFIEMFFTEAQLAAQLSHPNIAQIIEFGENEGVYFLAMEYVDGPSLRALASAAHAAGTGIPFAYSARIAAFCCEALTYAHELTDAATGMPLNLVHRDVSPDNVLVSKTGSVKLVDFGIAKAATQNHQTKTGLVKGKLAYMAPEQLRSEPLDRRADIFSLGVMLYELVTGAKPYDAPSEITLIHAILYEDKVPLKNRRNDVPPELERIINKALERDRDQRYSDCRAMHADLEEYLISVRQPVSALQIAHLVEKHRLSAGNAEATPQRGMATPNRSVPAKTPEPWRAERTPTASATAQLRQPRLKTGTDGDRGVTEASLEAAAPAPPPLVDKTELISPSKPAVAVTSGPDQPRPHRPEAPPPAHGPEAAPKSAAKRRPMIPLASAAAVLLLAGGIAFLRLSPTKPVESVAASKPPEQPPAVKEDQHAGAETPQPPPQTQQGGPVAMPPQPPSLPKPSPMVELILRSEPPGSLKVFVGGKMVSNHQSPLVVRLRPGPVEVEVSGFSGDQAFLKRESLSLDLVNRRMEHTITVGQGTVFIRSVPASHVKIDGVSKGDVPLKETLFEGEHVIQFECDKSTEKCAGMADAKQTVTVQTGKTIPIIQKWQ